MLLLAHTSISDPWATSYPVPRTLDQVLQALLVMRLMVYDPRVGDDRPAGCIDHGD
jgi:hypothetical protein